RAAELGGHGAFLRALGFHEYMMVPVQARGQTLGAVTLVLVQGARSYGPADLALAEEIGRRAGLAIDNARHYERAQGAVRGREELLAVVSHDLKNPLSAILMNVTYMLRKQRAGEATQSSTSVDQLEVIHRAAARMERLVSMLLDIGGLETGRSALERQPHAVA